MTKAKMRKSSLSCMILFIKVARDLTGKSLDALFFQLNNNLYGLSNKDKVILKNEWFSIFLQMHLNKSRCVFDSRNVFMVKVNVTEGVVNAK